jgi:hypothetical protein
MIRNLEKTVVVESPGFEYQANVYYLDRPGAWRRIGFAVFLLTMSGWYFGWDTKLQGDSWPFYFAAMFFCAGMSVYWLFTAIRTLCDRTPKLELDEAGIIDHRGQMIIMWQDVVGLAYAIEYSGRNIRRAVVTLTLRGASGLRECDINVQGLSEPPQAIYARICKFGR